MSDDAKLACRVLAGLEADKREYAYLISVLAERFPINEEEGPRRARAVRALMECMDSGAIQRVSGKLMTMEQLEKELGDG